MKIIEKIKALFTLNKIAKEATKMNNSKPGYLTTEFWGKTLIQLVILYNAFSSKDIPIETATIIIASLEAFYISGRSLVKSIKDIFAPK